MAVGQINLYINALILMVDALLGFRILVIQLQMIANQDDPNMISTLQKKRTNAILAGVVAVSISLFIFSIKLRFGFYN